LKSIYIIIIIIHHHMRQSQHAMVVKRFIHVWGHALQQVVVSL